MPSCFCHSLFKYLLFAISCLYIASEAKASSSLAQLTFKDKALEKCIKQQINQNNWQSIKDITNIKCHGLKIKSIENLSQLTALTSISLYNNSLINVDLRSFKHLIYINIANNKLTSTRIDGLNQLETLYLFKNKLQTINFSGLSQLKKIRITNNQLISLDISPLMSLEKAYFFDNKLEDLIVVGLPKLKFIELRQNPMPDEVYDRYDDIEGITIIHDGNADDWK